MYKIFSSIKIVLVLVFMSTQVYASPSKASIHALDVLNKWNNTLGQKNLLLHNMKFDNKFLEFKVKKMNGIVLCLVF
jgi:DNA polymerase III alpha subunit (gram-positive type)